MADLKAYLKLKIPKSHNIMGLSEENYEIINCEYEFYQDLNRVGEVCSEVKGGIINLSISDLPTDVLMAWIFDHTKRFNGEITIVESRYETLEQIYFENARCFDFRMHYKQGADNNTITHLKIASNQIRVGNAYFELSN